MMHSGYAHISQLLQERRRSSGTAASMIETELGALREQSLTHVKERVALKSILDDKVRALISDIGQSLAELPIEVLFPLKPLVPGRLAKELQSFSFPCHRCVQM